MVIPIGIVLWLLLTWLYGVSCTCTGSISQDQYAALENIFNSTGGEHWLWDDELPAITRWTFPSPYELPCSIPWQGVNCTQIALVPPECGVWSLGLDSRNMTGPFPSTVDALAPSLVKLNLQNNFLSGTIASGLFALTKLTILYLDYNFISGSIPTILGQLTAIDTLALSENRLTSSIPTELGYLTKLTRLELFNNFLSGPMTSQLTSLVDLTVLNADSNYLTGPLPLALATLPLASLINFESNYFTGSLPVQYASLSALVFFYVDSNYLEGVIPTEYGTLSELVYLVLSLNMLSGPVPQELSALSQCHSLLLDGNDLTGTLPSVLGSMPKLGVLFLSDNSMTGTLPSELGQVSSLIILYLYSNSFTGTIPSEWGELGNLNSIIVYDNWLTHTIPPSFGDMSSLACLALQLNLLSGSISSLLGRLAVINLVDLEVNYLTGTIPLFYNASNLQSFALNTNYLTGTIPTEFFSWNSLEMLYLNQNFLSGSLPSNWDKLIAVVSLIVSYNQLSGSIPDSVGQAVTLSDMDISSNRIEGVLPSGLGYLTNLLSLNISNNIIHGTIPNQLCNCSQLKVVYMNTLHLSGQVPTCLASLKYLEQLVLSQNDLQGSLAPVFSAPGSFPSLQIIDLSQNEFTGSLPDSLFAVSSLQTLSLYSNCFHGHLPTSICEAKNLTSLILDGLSSGASCQFTSLKSILDGVFPNWFMSGTVPECMWTSMPRLQTLHLSGNGLAGTLPDVLAADSPLAYLSLANNNIRGSVPLSFQTFGRFIELDLSTNKLSGTLQSSFNLSHTQQSLNMSVNRLSGNIPHSFELAKGVNVLTGNMFQCQYSSLPQSDPAKSKYVCGSDGLNDSALAWLGAIALVALCVISASCLGLINLKVWRSKGDVDTPIIHSVASLPDDKDAMQQYSVRNFSLLLFLVYSIVGSVVYLALKLLPGSEDYSTHSTQYGWVDSVIFLHGWVPTSMVLLLVFSGVVLGPVMILSNSHHELSESTPYPSSSSSSSPSSSSVSPALSKPQTWTLIAKKSLGHLVNIAIVLVVNVTYVYTTLQGLTPGSLLGLQAAVSVFKVAWNTVAIPWLAKRAGDTFIQRMSMTLFAFVVGPVVSTFFSQSSCFLYALVGQAPIESSFQLDLFQCIDTAHTECFLTCETVFYTSCGFTPQPNLVPTQVSAGWIYSYQCSSALIVDYVPVFIITYLISSFLLPLLVVCLTIAPLSSSQLALLHTMHIPRVDEMRNAQIISKLMLNVTMMMTFGLANPLLAVAVAVDSLVFVCLYRWRVSRVPAAALTTSLLKIEHHHHSTTRGFHESIKETELSQVLSVVSVIVGVFWSLFVLDMLGDVYGGLVGSCCMLISMIGCPFVFIVSKRFWIGRKEKNIFSFRDTELSNIH